MSPTRRGGLPASPAALLAGAVLCLVLGLAVLVLPLLDRGSSDGSSPADSPPAATDGTAAGPGPVDIGFAQDMVVHHAQALVMAGLAHDRTDDPALLAIARQILLGQSREPGILQGWLILWQQPQLPSGPPMTWMSSGEHGEHGGRASDGGASVAPMPGMATQAQLDRLGRRTGDRFDALFARLMIRHHLGGIAMAREAAERAALLEVRTLATGMERDQLQEVALLRATSG